jgi:hypothetical protein
MAQPAEVEEQRLVHAPHGEERPRQRRRTGPDLAGCGIDHCSGCALAAADGQGVVVAAIGEHSGLAGGIVPEEHLLDASRGQRARLDGGDHQPRLHREDQAGTQHKEQRKRKEEGGPAVQLQEPDSHTDSG